MSRSLEFVIKTASDPTRSNYADRDWSKAKEVEATAVFPNDKYYIHQINLAIQDENGEIGWVKIMIEYNDTVDFDYFTSATSIHDGTLAFETELLRDCANKVVSLKTYYAPKGIPHVGDEVWYTIGNFVVLNEFDKKYATKAKPWLIDRTTVALPIKYEVLRNAISPEEMRALTEWATSEKRVIYEQIIHKYANNNGR